MQLFGTKGQKFHHCPGTNETTGQAKNIAKGREGPGQPKSGTGRAGTAKPRDGTWDKTNFRYIVDFDDANNG